MNALCPTCFSHTGNHARVICILYGGCRPSSFYVFHESNSICGPATLSFDGLVTTVEKDLPPDSSPHPHPGAGPVPPSPGSQLPQTSSEPWPPHLQSGPSFPTSLRTPMSGKARPGRSRPGPRPGRAGQGLATCRFRPPTIGTARTKAWYWPERYLSENSRLGAASNGLSQ